MRVCKPVVFPRGDSLGGVGGTEGGSGARVLGGADPGIAAGASGRGGDDGGGCQVGQSQSWGLLPLQESEMGLCAAKVSRFFITLFIFSYSLLHTVLVRVAHA